MSLAPAASSSLKCESSGTCFELWNIMCSKRWANPVRPGASLAGPTWYHRLTATIGSPRFGLSITSSPFGSVIFSNVSCGMSEGRRACVLGWAVANARPATTSNAIESGRRMDDLGIEASPQIPARNRTIRTPGFANPVQAIRRRRFAKAVGLLHRLDDAQIVHRQHVGPVQAEHQKHLGGPAADAFHLGQRRDHLVVGHHVEPVQRQRAVVHPGPEIAHVAQLLAAQSHAAQLPVGERGQRPRRGRPVEERHQTSVDRVRRLGGQLLRHDGFHQRPERLGVLRVRQAAFAVHTHQVAQNRITPGQVPAGAGIVGGHSGEARSPRSYFKLKVTVTWARTSIWPTATGGAPPPDSAATARTNGMGVGGGAPPVSSIRTSRSSVRPAPAAAASAFSRAFTTARRTASRSSLAWSFMSNRRPLTDVAPWLTTASSSSPTRLTSSTRTSIELRAIYPLGTRLPLVKSNSCWRS